jgi:hypothetical protein
MGKGLEQSSRGLTEILNRATRDISSGTVGSDHRPNATTEDFGCTIKHHMWHKANSIPRIKVNVISFLVVGAGKLRRATKSVIADLN